ncbi:MAG TPA: helix-turn-helix domain-containing protein [Methanomicrobiales archaeon]|nr:helix-turn-helix domain-containing protein [Methanomicrobiales archaeon]
MPGRFLPEREAAARLGVPPSTLKAMIKNGEIGAVKKGRVTMVPVSDIDEFLDQRQGRMAGDLTMSEVRSLDEFKQHLVRALDDQVVKQALQQCMGGAAIQRQVLEALDAPEVQAKITRIRGS